MCLNSFIWVEGLGKHLSKQPVKTDSPAPDMNAVDQESKDHLHLSKLRSLPFLSASYLRYFANIHLENSVSTQMFLYQKTTTRRKFLPTIWLWVFDLRSKQFNSKDELLFIGEMW